MLVLDEEQVPADPRRDRTDAAGLRLMQPRAGGECSARRTEAPTRSKALCLARRGAQEMGKGSEWRSVVRGRWIGDRVYAACWSASRMLRLSVISPQRKPVACGWGASGLARSSPSGVATLYSGGARSFGLSGWNREARY